MCYIEIDDPWQTWSDKARKARKRHRCDCCFGQINPGEQYTDHFHVEADGFASSEKVCQSCTNDRQEFADAHDGIMVGPSDLVCMWLPDCIADGDYESETKWEPMFDRICANREANRQPA